ncbi:MAG: HEAT repeat domain-containing protein [Candidatus Binataceae bacterium]
MTFFCTNCFAELAPGIAACPSCGAAQNPDSREYVAKLLAARSHPLADIRRCVIFLLGEKRLLKAVNALIQVTEKERDPFMVDEAVGALGKIGNAQALDGVIGSFIVRARAVETLVAAGDGWEKTARIRARADSSAMVREAAWKGQKGLSRITTGHE